MRTTVRAFPLILALASCSFGRVEDLSFSDSDGSSQAVYAEKAKNARFLGEENPESEYFFSSEEIPGDTDLALTLTGEADIRVTALYQVEDDKKATVDGPSAVFPGLGAVWRDLRLALEAGTPLAGLRLTVEGEGSVTLHYIGLRPRYIGYRAASDKAPELASAGVRLVMDASGAVAEVSFTQPVPKGGSLAATGRQEHPLVFGESTRFTLQALGRESAIPLAFLDTAVVRSSGGIEEVRYVPGNGAPLADLHSVLDAAWPGGDYALYRWDALPGTLILDFKDYATQDRYLKRLAFFAEKPGFRGRIASDEEIAGLHGWNAHDYPTWTLRNFYTLAESSGFTLNQSEYRLLDLLVAYGILRRGEDGSLSEGAGAVISFTRESSAALRRLFADHEASHALFFQDQAYRDLTAALWNAQPKAALDFWLEHFQWRSYDTADDYLMVNEYQAYLVQQSVSATRWYVGGNVMARLSAVHPERASYHAATRAIVEDSSVSSAAELDSYLARVWGLGAGRLGRLESVSY